MRTLCRGGLLVLTTAALVGGTGCGGFVGGDRTSNQGGGTVLSAGSKLAADELCGLTPDEWQLATDNADMLASLAGFDVSGYELPPITDEQAEAIVDFLALHGVCTFDDLTALAESPDLEIPPELEELVALFS